MNIRCFANAAIMVVISMSSVYSQQSIITDPVSESIFGTPGASRLTRNIVGLWTFDNPDDLTAASIGNDLELIGSHQPSDGPEVDDGAVNIGVGSYYRCYHDIPPNGSGGNNPQWVNRFSILIDFFIPTGSQWYTFYQTNYANSNDGDAFVNTSNQIGVGDTGYSDYQVIPGEWYRLVISTDLGVHYDYYLDGQFLHNGGAQVFEGRFALYSSNGQNQVLFFADNNGEDNAFTIAQVALFDTDLNATEIAALGGFGHELPEPPEAEMNPYLQSPTPNSIYISWHSALSAESTVEYGTSNSLGQSETGEVQYFDSQTVWHTVHLTGLVPDTEYYYRCLTDTAATPIHSFRTQPENDSSDHIRFAVYGDTRTDHTTHTMVVEAMREKFIELYGTDYRNQVNLIFNVGDIVSNGWTLSQYILEHFNPITSISNEIPYMISIGNHEAEADYFYQYMKYEDFSVNEGERYYSFRLGKVLMIALNSNTQGGTQLNWLQNTLISAQDNDEIDWVFAFLHHPGRSEIWPDGNTWWVQNSVIPLLEQYSKVELLTYGHSHNYERGAQAEGNLRLMLSGGGGSALDRWGMYNNQTDYTEIHRALDHYCYTIIDIDVAENIYSAETYSLGHNDLPLDNVLIDSFYRDRNLAAPEIPIAVSPSGFVDEPIILTASEYSGEQDLMSSHFQLIVEGGTWLEPTVEQLLDWENIYDDTGSPNYEPIDLNEGIDLAIFELENDQLTSSTNYQWRIRYRDQNLNWSDWSVEQTFYLVDDSSLGDLDQNNLINILDVIITVNIILGAEPSEYQLWAGDINSDGFINVMDIVQIINIILNIPQSVNMK